MTFDPPEPGAALNFGEPTPARPAATVILVRNGTAPLEVLIVKRGPEAPVMAGTWVFPGGTSEPADGDGEAGLRATARRELVEETGIALGQDHELLAFARWITPPQVTYRFDTWFFVAAAPAGAVAQVDGGEVVEERWVTPGAALAERWAGRLTLVFPTIKQLERLTEFETVAELLAHTRGSEVEAILPRVVANGEDVRILLPGDPGYED